MSKVIGEIDEYTCTVSADIAKIAAEELREDENIRSQTLKSFREWIMKNENILKCRLDSSFLLRFLRVKKYSLPLAQEILMNHLAVRTILPEYFQNMDVLDPVVDQMFSEGGIMVLKGRDDDGRRVVFVDYEKIKATKEAFAASVKTYITVLEVLLCNEDSQITGLTTIVGFKGIGIGHVVLFSPTFFQKLAAATMKSHAVRFHKIHYVFVPDIFAKTVELAKHFIGPKIASRLIVHNAEQTLKDIIPKRMLPLEFGGEAGTIQELINDWKEELLQHRDILLSLDQLAIDDNYKIKRMNDTFQNWGTEGSFRQLQID